MFPGTSGNPDGVFLTPIDSYYKEYNLEEDIDTMPFSNEDINLLNSLIRDYYINDNDELSFTKVYSLNCKNPIEIKKLDKLSGSTVDTKEERDKLNKSFDCLERNDVDKGRKEVKESEQVVTVKKKLSRLLKEDWKDMVDYIKKSLFIALKDNIANQSVSMNYGNNAKINNTGAQSIKNVNINRTNSFNNSIPSNAFHKQRLTSSSSFNC